MSLDNPLKSVSDYDDMFFGAPQDSFCSSLSDNGMMEYGVPPQHRLSTSSTASSGYASSRGFDIKMETPEPTSTNIDTSLEESMGANGGEMDASMEIYRELILRHLIQDIQATCTRLGIPNDPDKWKPEESLLWIQEMTSQFQLGQSVVAMEFALPGRQLCLMQSTHFCARCPEHGDTLHAQLQIWKTAAEYSAQMSTNNQNANDHSGDMQADYSGWGAGTSGYGQNMHMEPASTSYNPSAPEWLAGFDPLALTNDFNAHNQQHKGYLESTPGLSVQTYANGNMHFSQNPHVLDSPCGSDSGVSSDFEDGLDVSPASLQGLPGTGTGSIHLWQFIRELLDHPDRFRSCVRWLDRTEGLFKIEDSHKLARLWGQRKNRTKMNYDKLSRSLRQYYKKNIIRKTGQRQRLIYQFVPPYHLL